MIAQYKTPLPTSRLYVIHHSILVVTISCKGQPVPFGCTSDPATFDPAGIPGFTSDTSTEAFGSGEEEGDARGLSVEEARLDAEAGSVLALAHHLKEVRHMYTYRCISFV